LEGAIYFSDVPKKEHNKFGNLTLKINWHIQINLTFKIVLFNFFNLFIWFQLGIQVFVDHINPLLEDNFMSLSYFGVVRLLEHFNRIVINKFIMLRDLKNVSQTRLL
jgi:hypothetical protein